MSNKNMLRKNSVNGSYFVQIFLTIIGSVPTIYICIICAWMFQQDLKNNGYSLNGQSRFFSMVEKFEYYENVTCSNDYANDLIKFPTCAPKYCARFFTDLVISDKETNILLKMAKRVLSNSDSPDASNLYFDLNLNKILTKDLINDNNLQENNENIFPTYEFKTKNGVLAKIKDEIKKRFKIEDVYLTNPAFFQKIVNQSNNYIPLPKVDKKINDAFIYVAILYLNDHQLDYYGGRIKLDDLNKSTFLSIEPKKSRLLVYTSGSENQNQIEQLENGERYSMTAHFTCDKNLSI